MMHIFWFRRDLRLTDNVGLFHALNSDQKVLPIFIFDETILEQLPADDARVSFIHEQLSSIQTELQKHGTSLAVFHGNPIDVFQKLITENPIHTVFTNHDYEPAARKRDLEIYRLLEQHQIEFRTSKDQVIFEKSQIVKDDGSPYVVYTPFSKKWKDKFSESLLTHHPSESLFHNIATHSYPFLSLENIRFEKSCIQVKPYNIAKNLIDNYSETRNFPALEGTSNLSPHLRFGTVSIRQLVREALQSNNSTFLNELIWREFFMQILWHFPHTVQKSFKPAYDGILWNNNERDFELWCQGKTGYPMVDAGMRELNATGYMHNRVRMVVASFLCKHLLIDWRWGEAYFALKLLDYEQASNIGNWQWAAGSGVDAAPYFRIFNPTEQIRKFDADWKYIKKWIPEVETSAYPKPVVDHKEARERCLRVYKLALD